MKLSTLFGLLLVLGTVYSVPLDSGEQDEPTMVPDPTEESPMDMDMGEDPEEILEEMWDTNTTMEWDMDEDGATEASAYFTEEVKKYFEEQKLLKSSGRETRQISGALYHGNTVGLQTSDRWYWLACSFTPCRRYPCPKLYMSGSDWTNCWGEVFRIYRAAGPGIVRVGDLVGIYTPAYTGRWLGCSGNECAKATCPGYPTTAYGFQNVNSWYQCWGEVFRIYSPGRSVGTVISSGDDVSFFYLQQSNWLSLGGHLKVHKSGACLGSTPPYSYHAHDNCPSQIFHVWKREY